MSRLQVKQPLLDDPESLDHLACFSLPSDQKAWSHFKPQVKQTYKWILAYVKTVCLDVIQMVIQCE